ncbi:MAG: zeta toxin family protein [Verrucomicrobia bacterium]|nr:zeta toxin family protein [Cytophagales bacterium]
MKELIIIGGANGSGKTTFAKELIKETSYYFLNADEIERNLEEPKSDVTQVKAGRLFFEKLEALLEKEQNFIVESTLSGKYLVKIIEKLKQENYKIRIVYVFLESPEICIERIKIRVIFGGHFIPDEIVKRRYYRSKENFWNVYKNMADEWQLFYNSFTESPVQVAIGNAGSYLVENESFMQEFLNDVKI